MRNSDEEDEPQLLSRRVKRGSECGNLLMTEARSIPLKCLQQVS
jgi:hypothetical protein